MTRELRVLVVIDDNEPLELGCATIPEDATVHDLVSSLRNVADRLETWRAFRDIVGDRKAS